MILALSLIAVLLLGSAALAMLQRNLIHSALLLVLAWSGIAAFYLWAGAEFVAFAQILVYVGAVSMVVLFAVLLTRPAFDDREPIPADSALRGIYGFLAAAMVGAVLIPSVIFAPVGIVRAQAPSFTVRDLGHQLMGPHIASLLVVGAILTVALIGAIVIASVDRAPAGSSPAGAREREAARTAPDRAANPGGSA